jgi:ribosomal protein S18 acetylase RimI-like enzyme
MKISLHDAHDLPTTDAIQDAALLHEVYLHPSLASICGSMFIAKIYSELILRGHKIILALDGQRVVGGLVLLYSSKRNVKFLSVLTSPISWIHACRKIGLYEMIMKVIDQVQITFHNLRLNPDAQIVALYVSESHQRSGLGSMLLARALREVPLDHASISVDTLKNNSVAQNFYNSMGFKRVATTSRSVIFLIDR